LALPQNPPSMSTADSQNSLRHAFLTAGGTVVSLILAEWLCLKHSDLAVWTTYLVMVQYAFTRFQKGVERIVGRGLGIVAGLVRTIWFHETTVLTLVLIASLLTIFFYLYFAERLAYTFLQAGLYLVAMYEIGHSYPTRAVAEAEQLFAAVVLGVL